MKNPTISNNETKIILDYIFKKTSWRKLIFCKFSSMQKILFFLPVPFLFFSIYGVYDLFHNNSWFLFIFFGLMMLLSIWVFFKIKSNLEKQVFEKFYLSESCKTLSDYHIENVSKLLGEYNTFENRALWKDFFTYKFNIFPFIIPIPIFGFIFFNILTRPHDKYYILGFYFAFFLILILLISFVFIMPAITDFKFKRTAYNEAFKLISEMDNKLTKE